MKHQNKKDEALSPIVAFLLLLMVVVSFISLLNAIYIPSLKQEDEIRHLQSVQEMFSSLTGDISQMAQFQKDISFQKRMQLGGGAALFSPITSSGTLQLEQKNLLKLVITDGADALSPGEEIEPIPITTVKISYQPIGNFWVDQGYTWERGLVSVTKPSKSTWLEYIKNADAEKAEEFFLKTVFTPHAMTNTTISIYTFTADPDSLFRSGNGMSGIDIFITKKEEKIFDVLKVELQQDVPDPDAEKLRNMLQNIIDAWKEPVYGEGGSTNVIIEIYDIRMRVV
ncbi:MAG: hypothetical protein LBV40_06975 [Methanomicrobiales archaeon]|jgi:hypothetical protein|nr:hypothetical protein [Methanomicrobiales archaeon]